MPDYDKKEVIKRDPMNYPSNSYKAKETVKDEKEEPKKVEKVVKGKVVTKKKSLGRRFWDTFVGEDIADIGNYLIHDVLVPAAKSTITDMVQSIPELLFYHGEHRPSRSRRDGGRTRVSYEKCYDSDRRGDRRELSREDRARHNFDDIILESKRDADEIIERLIDIIDEYGQATVADLYDLVGVTEAYTDRSYGWTNLRKATWRHVSEGYMLVLPKPVLLD
jgi:hypothetical protein